MSDKQILSDKQTLTVARLINIAALFALLGVLAGSLDLQFGAGELPCPLCLVQRSAMIGLAVGPAMNLLWGMKARHYALSILAALVGGAGSARQILLHIATPGDPGFGPAVLGFHLYTWAFITFVIAVAGCAVLLMWNRPFDLGDTGVLGQRHWHRSLTLFITIWGLLWLLADLLVIGISVIPQCGLGMCPDDPPPGADFGAIVGWVLVLGLGAVAAVIAYFVERRMGESPQERERELTTQ
jgi:disulfide bond formation protein DsbB